MGHISNRIYHSIVLVTSVRARCENIKKCVLYVKIACNEYTARLLVKKHTRSKTRRKSKLEMLRLVTRNI